MTKKENNIKYFKDEVNRFIDYFGLYDWRVYIEEQTDKDSLASCHWHELRYRENDDHNGGGQTATIYYSKHWVENKKTTKEQLSRTAFHEVLEIMLCKLRDYAVNTKYLVTEMEIDNEIHRLIRIFENKLHGLIT